MKSVSEARWLICRICLSNGTKKLHPIDDEENPANEHGMENIHEKIELIGGMKIDLQSNLPNKICERCLLLLRASCKFRYLCEQSERQLKQFIRPPKEITLDEDNDNDLGNFVEGTVNEPDEESNLFADNQQDLDEYVPDDVKPLAALSPPSTAEHFAPEQYDNELADSNEMVMSHHPDNLDDDDVDELVFDHTNESSQEEQEELLGGSNEIPNTYTVDTLHLEYSDAADELNYVKYVSSSQAKTKEKPKTTAAPKTGERRRRTAKVDIYKCGYCGNLYQDRAKYVMHVRIHKNVKPHECEICGKRFSTTPQLSRHMNSHTGNRPFKCQYCEASFGDPSTKIKHERIHTNERPFKCDRCNKSFAYSNVLKVHMMVHTGEKPHACKLCGKTFAQLHHKNTHEKRHRGVVVMLPESEEIDNEDDLKDFELEIQ